MIDRDKAILPISIKSIFYSFLSGDFSWFRVPEKCSMTIMVNITKQLMANPMATETINIS